MKATLCFRRAIHVFIFLFYNVLPAIVWQSVQGVPVSVQCLFSVSLLLFMPNELPKMINSASFFFFLLIISFFSPRYSWRGQSRCVAIHAVVPAILLLFTKWAVTAADNSYSSSIGMSILKCISLIIIFSPPHSYCIGFFFLSWKYNKCLLWGAFESAALFEMDSEWHFSLIVDINCNLLSVCKNTAFWEKNPKTKPKNKTTTQSAAISSAVVLSWICSLGGHSSRESFWS